MQHDLTAFLWDIDAAANDIIAFIEGIQFEQYTVNKMIRAAVERQFITIGEALVQARKLAPDLYTHIHQVPDIVAFRNRVVHGYMTTDDSTVWHIARDYLPILQEDVRRLLAQLDSNSEPPPAPLA